MDNLNCERPNNPNSFSFCGIRIEDVGLEYIPSNDNTYVYKPSNYTSHEEIFDGHDGGYYYGATLQPKDFILRCYYEHTDIRDGLMNKIFNLFKRGRTGYLVFSNRPWLWYKATVNNVDISQMYNYENGIVTIKLRSYYPFARSDYFYIHDNDEDQANNSNALSREELVPETEFENIIEQTELYLYNPGTETSKVLIDVQGEAPDGFSIANAKTRHICRFIALTDSATTDVSKHLICDSISGKTYLKSDNGTTEYAFLFHDSGFLDVSPSEFIIRNIDVSYTAGSNTITVPQSLEEFDYVNKHMFIDGEWRELVSHPSETTYVVSSIGGGIISHSGTNKTDIVSMDKIVITPSNPDNFNLTQLKFVFDATYA